MAFKNRIRIPIQLHSPQFPEERDVFRKANGQSQTLSVVIRKTYELETDWFIEKWHQQLKIALAHDDVILEGEKYVGNITQDGDYQIDWQDTPLRYPTAKAGVKVQVTPFDATNSNCQTCEEAIQVVAEDDDIGTRGEGEDFSILDIANNDRICCYPAVFSLLSYNTTYLDSATIDPATGVFTASMKDDLTSANGIILATYRVTCPNGGYDDANIIANVAGSVVGCLAPSGLVIDGITSTTANASWTEAVPGSTYSWELYVGVGPIGSPVQSGSVTDDNLALTGLDASTTYYFRIRTECIYASSNYVASEFSTIAGTVSCGSYKLTNTGDEPFTVIVYKQCDGNNSTPQYILYQNWLFVCALENSPGDPVLISASPNVTIEYLGSC